MRAEEKKRWMRRAFQLALLGAEKAAPNPLVGCVLIHREQGLIGEGWHRAFGQAHAEVNAIASVKNPELIPGCTAILNLEPCSHYGKTPPCASLLIEKKVGKVIISNTDPNPLVAGKGIALLREAGIEVEYGILEGEGRELNRFFFTAQEKKRPYVTLKWAQSADGYLAADNGNQVWISSPQSRLVVHKLRAEHQAIYAGRGTLRKDNPLLNLRQWPGRQPIRIVSDPALSLPQGLQLFSDPTAPVWIFNESEESSSGNFRRLKCRASDDPARLLEAMWQEGVHSVLVEGGAFLLQLFLEQNLWDRALVFEGNAILNSGIPAPRMEEGRKLQSGSCGPDRVFLYQNMS